MTHSDLEAFRGACREFCAAYAGEHGRWEAEGIVPRRFWRAAGDAGLLGLAVPAEFGGPGREGYRWQAILIDEIIAAGLTAPGIVAHNDVVASFLLARANKDQQRRWLPGVISGETMTAIAITEPTGGSDLAGLRATAIREGDHYVLSGEKSFITNGETADLIFVVCRTGAATGARGLGMIAVERGTPGLERGPRLRKLGWHASDTCDLRLNDCRVPADNLIGAEGAATMYLMAGMPRERLSIAVVAVAAAERMLARAVAYAKERQLYGASLGSLQNTRFMLAELDTEVTIARVFIDHCVAALDAGRLTIAEAAKAKLWTTEMQARVADRALQLHGGRGYLADDPVAHDFANARVQSIYGGTSEVMKELIGRCLGL